MRIATMRFVAPGGILTVESYEIQLVLNN